MGRPRKDATTQDVRERLIVAMADRLIREPASAVTVTSLIKEVGCNRSTFYYFFHLLKVINLLIEYLGILSSANALAGRSTPLSAGSGAQACPDGQIHRPFGWFGVAGMPWRADQRLFGRFGGAGMP